MWRLREIQNDLANLRGKFEAQQAEYKNKPLATKEGLDDAVSQIVDAVQDLDGPIASSESEETSTTFQADLPAHFTPPR